MTTNSEKTEEGDENIAKKQRRSNDRSQTPCGEFERRTRCSREEADAALRRITQGETIHGLTKDDLLLLPDRRFFRIRGLAEFGDYRNPGSDATGVGYVYLPYDVHGNVLTDREKLIERGDYVDYLRAVLPTRYMASRYWEFVKSDFLFNENWGTPEPVKA